MSTEQTAAVWWLGSTIGPKLIPVTVLRETKTRVVVVDPYFNTGRSWYEQKVCRSNGNEYEWIEPDREAVFNKLLAACAREVIEVRNELLRKKAAFEKCKAFRTSSDR